jgi:hypothetical protein
MKSRLLLCSALLIMMLSAPYIFVVPIASMSKAMPLQLLSSLIIYIWTIMNIIGNRGFEKNTSLYLLTLAIPALWPLTNFGVIINSRFGPYLLFLSPCLLFLILRHLRLSRATNWHLKSD